MSIVNGTDRSNPSSAQAARFDRRTEGTFADEERSGLMQAARIRTISLCCVLLWQVVDNIGSGLEYAYDLAMISLFILLGLAQYFCARGVPHLVSLKYLFVAADCILLTLMIAISNPFVTVEMPYSLTMRDPLFLGYFIFLVQAAFSFRPRVVMWCGLCIVAVRTATLVWVVTRPEIVTNVELAVSSRAELLKVVFDPNFVSLGRWLTECIFTVILTAGLAAIVARSRRLVESRARTERSRANLARYFSPNVVDRLSDRSELLREARETPVAVLFADIMGFTALCEKQPADTVIDLLREYHDRLAAAVFKNDGTLDKYIGDGLMATFGTPASSGRDAGNAVRCGLDMIAALAEWNRQREGQGLERIRVGIGIHYGPVIVGDIGNERRLEFGVIGDTVNTASRIEHLTRDLGTPLIVSADVVSAVRGELEDSDSLVERFAELGSQPIRGRRGALDVWGLRSS